VRLDGDEMAADPDDGDAGHVPRTFIRVTACLLASGICDGHRLAGICDGHRLAGICDGHRLASCPGSDPVPADFDPVCSFCGKKKSDGNRRFIAGPASVYICEECVDLCAEILEEERRA
jgi:hypothetical protein